MRYLSLVVPKPAVPKRLDRFLAANIHGLSRKQAKGLLDAGQVRVGGRTERKAAAPLQPGQTVELDYRPSLFSAASPIGPHQLVAEGPSWLAINKPRGVPSHRPSEDVSGVPELLEGFPNTTDAAPVHRLDRETTGLLVLATTPEVRATLSDLFATRAIEKTYRAVVHPAPKEDAGVIEGPEDMVSRWQLLRRSSDGSRGELAVFPQQGRTHQIRIQLASIGCPIIGDLEYGNVVVGGAPRMALHCERMAWPGQTLSCPPPDGWDALLEPSLPTPALPQPVAKKKDRRRSPSRKLRTLQVSSATARILRAGHPWVIRDGDTGNLGLYKRGDLAQLVDPQNAPVATALIDPQAAICARVVAQEGEYFPAEQPWESRALRAASRRTRTIASADTDAYRVIHGEADGLPGLFIDRWGDVLVATRTTPIADSFRSVYAAVLDETSCTALWEQDHFEDLRSRGSAPSSASREGRWVIGSRSIERWTVLEGGLRYLVEPTAGLTHGLYTDQRTNRDMLRRLIEEDPSAGSRVANLFSHTAAFSVACAAAGASKVISVDLARRYSEWAAQNLALNGLSTADHPVVAEGAMEWLRAAEGLSGVIIDPPGHARSKKAAGMDWNARRDYRALVTAAAAALQPGGWLLCCLNLKGLKRDWLRREVEKGMQTANRKVSGSLAIAPPSPDHPRRKGFPEGRAFHGLFVRTES